MRISDWSSDVCSSDLAFLQRWGSGLAIAASLVLGLMLGTQIHSGGAIAERNGALMASGALARGLDTRLASADADSGGLRILASFQRAGGDYRSEEHTSELQSLMRHSYAVFCLNKKKNK